MQSEFLFALLLVGLEKYTHAPRSYPFPPELQHAMNGLALMMGRNYPKTHHGFMDLMNLPLTDWWSVYGGAEIPDFNPNFALLNGDELSDWAEDYVVEGKLRGVNVSELLVLQDNSHIRRFVEEMRELYQKSLDDAMAEEIESHYSLVRKFIVENAFTHPSAIRRHIPTHYHQTVMDMYISASQNAARFLFDDAYWHCHECGMVYVNHEGHRHGQKADVCYVRCPGQPAWQELSDDSNLMVLRSGIQRRTLIPGRIELDLYQWLEQVIQPEFPQLQAITLYPGVDRYDMKLQYSDNEIWAVDVKDYRLPTELGAAIGYYPEPYGRLDSRLRWDKAFYVVSDDREETHPGYCHIASVEAGLGRYTHIALMTVRKFQDLVTKKIWELKEE